MPIRRNATACRRPARMIARVPLMLVPGSRRRPRMRRNGSSCPRVLASVCRVAALLQESNRMRPRAMTSPSLSRPAPRSIPARAGIGLRAQHHEDLLNEKWWPSAGSLNQSRRGIGWLEAHSENYFADGGAQIDYLLQLREHYPLSLHGVGLSLGST